MKFVLTKEALEYAQDVIDSEKIARKVVNITIPSEPLMAIIHLDNGNEVRLMGKWAVDLRLIMQVI